MPQIINTPSVLFRFIQFMKTQASLNILQFCLTLGKKIMDCLVFLAACSRVLSCPFCSRVLSCPSPYELAGRETGYGHAFQNGHGFIGYPKGRNVERALGPSCPCVLCIPIHIITINIESFWGCHISHSLGLYLLHQI